MPSLALVEFIERLPSLWSRSCGSVAGSCVVLETFSFFQLVLRTSTTPVVCLRASLLLGAATLAPVTLDFL
jgi:hypothetical protein